MRAELRYLGEGMKFEGITESGQTQRIDDAKNVPTPIGPSPLELLLQSVAACTAMDVVSILGKMRRRIAGLLVTVDADRREEYPRIFTKIHLHFELTSLEATESELARAISLSQEKYCSVAGMLRPTVTLSHSWALRRA